MKIKLVIALLLFIIVFAILLVFSQQHNSTTVTPNVNSETTGRNTTTGKKILTPTKYGFYDWPYQTKGCETKNINADPPSQWVKYTNKEKGIEMNFPFNPDWGCSHFGVNPFETTELGIKFGQITQGHQACCVRFYSLIFLPPSSIEEALASAKVKRDPSTIKSLVKEVNGNQALFYEGGPFCDEATLEIVGTKQNYEISTYCGYGFEDLEEIAKTIKLLD